MRRVLALGAITFLEARRNKTTLAFLLFALVLVLTSFLFQEVTYTAYDRIIRDVGLASIHVFGILLAVYLGSSVITREIDKKSIYHLLTKQLGRSEFLLGKLLGVGLTLFVTLGLMVVAFIFENIFCHGPLPPIVFKTLWLIFMELMLISSFAIFASTFTSPLMAAFMAIGLFIIGQFSSSLYWFGQKSPVALVRNISSAVFYFLPNLDRLNLKTEASLLQPVKNARVLGESVYALLYVAIFMISAMAIFRKRDLK